MIQTAGPLANASKKPGEWNRMIVTLQDGKLTPMALDPELEKDALAHLLLPDLLHRQQTYRLPPQP